MQQHSCILQEIYDEFELVIPADKLYALGDIINMLNVTTTNNKTTMEQSLINSIRNKRAALDKAQNEKDNTIRIANERAIAKIKTFANDFKELKEVADEMQSNGFTLGRMAEEYSPEFITNWWSHHIGFYPEEHPTSLRNNQLYNLKGFGKMNGGACGCTHLVIDFDGNIISKGAEYSDGRLADVIYFANGFEKFKADFMEYVTKQFN